MGELNSYEHEGSLLKELLQKHSGPDETANQSRHCVGARSRASSSLRLQA